MKNKKISLLPLIVALFGHASVSNAALIAYDPFNQAVGGLDGTSSSGGGAIWASDQNWSVIQGTADVVTGSLSYGSLVTEGNSMLASGASNNAAFRNMGTTLGGVNSVIWLSFLVVIEAGSENSGISLFTGVSGGTEHNFIGAAYGSGLTGEVYGTQNIGFQDPNYNSGIALGSTTHFMVVRFDQINDTNTMWIDPDFSSLGNGAAPTGGTTSGELSRADFSWDNVRIGDFNFATDSTRVDEIRFGDTWMDVSPVPEPSAILLSCVGALALLRRRR